MMMPDCGEIEILYNPDAKDGFRLGLLEDFGLPNEAPDPKLDDIVHVETAAEGGILSGSNPRSVLYAVYRLLKENGCRFLFPGVDGEFIPRKAVEGVSYHKAASYRFRGHTTEGHPSLEEVVRYIDYIAKNELNVYALFSVYPYFIRYYEHGYNSKNMISEPVDNDTIDQWKVMLETEISKRGIQIHDGGHGWVERAAGFKEADRLLYKRMGKPVAEHIIPNLAMLNGKRGLYHKDPCYTQICMSRADLRENLANIFVAHCEKNPQVNYVKLALADMSKNYCECEECRKLRPSDWYVMILNEIDEKLTAKGIETKIILVAYNDLMFPPIRERFVNPSRFLLQYTPIAKSYLSSITEDSVLSDPTPFTYNDWLRPQTTEEAFSNFKEWKKVYPGACLGYEYHFWRVLFRDPGLMSLSRRIYEDNRSLRVMELDGCVEDGSNKAFFPNGFADHIYCASLWDRDLDYEAELEDYFSHCYGKDWEKVKRYLKTMSDTFDFAYMLGKKSADVVKGVYYNPEHVRQLADVKELCAEARELIQSHLAMPTRPQTVCWRLLLRHTEFCEGVAEIMTEKCLGHDKRAFEHLKKFEEEFGKYEHEIGRLADIGLMIYSLTSTVNTLPVTAIEM